MYDIKEYDNINVGDVLIYKPFSDSMFYLKIQSDLKNSFEISHINLRNRWRSRVFYKCLGDLPDIYKVKEMYRWV